MKCYLLFVFCLIVSVRAEVTTLVEPSQKMPEGKTVVWSPLFQATWDAMNVKMGGKPMRVEPANELMKSLDDFKWESEKVMPKGSWKTWAGPATKKFLNQVNEEAAKMTGDADETFQLNNLSPESIASFGLLNREVEFKESFHKSIKTPMQFGEAKSAVRFFGTKDSSSDSYDKSVRILAFRPIDGSFALEAACKGVDDKVILYMPPRGKEQDFQTACKWLREWKKSFAHDDEALNAWNDRFLHTGDEVRIPYVSLDTMDDFADQLNSGRFYGIAGDPWTIRRAEQKTKFELFEKGARVRVEAVIEMDPFAARSSHSLPPIPRKFFYDKPFFVFMWRDQAELPYLGVWVGDDSVLKKF